eukprot:RCo015182
MFHIPLHRLVFIRFPVIAADVRTAFLMYHQSFTRADMGNNGITGNRAATFGKANQHATGTPDWQFAVSRRGFFLRLLFMLSQQTPGNDYTHLVTEANISQQAIQ